MQPGSCKSPMPLRRGHRDFKGLCSFRNGQSGKIAEFHEPGFLRPALFQPSQRLVEGQEVVWYDPAALHDLDGIGLLFVDGPPAATGHHARWPAVPLLADRMAVGGRVVLDDLIRDEEKEILARWQELRPTWTVESLLQHEKGSGVMTVGEGAS